MGGKPQACAVAFALLVLPLVGCLASDTLPPRASSDAPFTDLQAPRAARTVDAGGARSFVFEAVAPAGWRSPAGSVAPELHAHAFEVDARVAFVEVNLSYDPALADIEATLVDAWDRAQCTGEHESEPKVCTSPVPRNLTSRSEWTVLVGPGVGAATPGTAYMLNVTLHPPSHLPRADPRAGTDPAIRFRVSDTGVEGFEPTIGLLADGTLFVQENLKTMRSTDDGRTWKDTAPVTTAQVTFDPMLYADPWSGRVYVNQLYVGCSILAWSDDAGATWTTNPAACGAPVNDHQKVAVGPSPVPGSPFPVVYYSFFSFAKAVWVSRSLDGGVTFAASAIPMPPDAWPYNTGPVAADREGNVYVPMYFCDNGGWVGVGVSNDYGATYRLVKVSNEKGPCEDVDPGLAVDMEGVAYLAFNRPTGVKYAYSADRGTTWSEAVMVSPPSVRSWKHTDVTAGDAGRIAIAYRGTADTSKSHRAADGWAAWHLYVSFVERAASADPGIRTALANDPADLVQRGSICQGAYPPCLPGARNLGDFIDIATGPDGRVYVAYDDGCDDPCETPADSRSARGMVAIQEEGPRLFGTRAPWASARS